MCDVMPLSTQEDRKTWTGVLQHWLGFCSYLASSVSHCVSLYTPLLLLSIFLLCGMEDENGTITGRGETLHNHVGFLIKHSCPPPHTFLPLNMFSSYKAFHHLIIVVAVQENICSLFVTPYFWELRPKAGSKTPLDYGCQKEEYPHTWILHRKLYVECNTTGQLQAHTISHH